MARGERSDWVLLLLELLVLGCCAIFTRAHPPFQLTKGRVCRQHPPRRDSLCGWIKIGSFELLTVEELKEEMLGPWASNGEGSPLERDKPSVVTAANTSIINASTSRAKPLAVRLERVSQKLGKFAEGGGTTLWMWAGQSFEMGKRGAVWFQERWRVKLVYCALAIYGIRVAGRVACRFYTALRSAESSSDVILDADDRALGSRGAILDVEGVALLVKLGAVGHLAPADPVRSQSSHGKLEEEEENDHGWRAIEVEIRRAIGLRCNGGRKEQYAEELARALRGLEEARDNADIEAVGSQRASLLEQAVLLIQARLCDACLRSLRNGLVLSASDLSMLRAFWDDQKSSHRRMGVLKSIMLGRLHGKVFGKRATLEKDQEKISSCELLLEGHLRRLGGVQLHLQARPRISMEAVAPTSGDAFTEAAITSLKEWVDVGVEMLRCELEELETALLTVSDVTISPQRQRRLANGVGKEAMATDSIMGDGKGETEALTEHCWRPSNSTAAESGVGSEGIAEDAQDRANDPVTSGPRARTCLHLPVARLLAMPPLTVTMLRAGWDCGTNSSFVSPFVDCKTPNRASQDTLSGPSAVDENFMGARHGGTTLLKIYPGSSAIPAIVLLFRSNPKSKPGDDDGGVPEREPTTNSRGFNGSKTRPGKEGDSGRCAHQRPGWRKDERAIGEAGESKKKSTLVVDAWKWLTTAESSVHQHQRHTNANRPSDKAKPRAKGWDDINKMVGRTPRASSSRRSDTMPAGIRADGGGGGWIKLFASGDFGERRAGEETGTPSVETVNRSRTPKRKGALHEVASPKRLPLVQRRTSNIVIEGEANTKRFQIRKASEQKQASGGGRSKRFPSVAVEGRGSFAASKKDKVRAGAKALEGDNVKLGSIEEGRNQPHDLGGWQWESRVSSLAAAAKRESIRLFPFMVSRRNNADEGKGMVSGVLGDGLSAKGIIVVAAVGVTAAAVAALSQITGKAESSSYASTGGATPGTFHGDGEFSGTASPFTLVCRVRNSSGSLKATQQDVEDVDGSTTEHAGEHVTGIEMASQALLGCDSTDPRKSLTAGEESIDNRCEYANPAESDVDPRLPVEDRNTTGVGEGGLAFEETRPSRYEQGGTSRVCHHRRLGNSLSRIISFCCREATVTAGRARAVGTRGVRISSKFGVGCVRFAGIVLTLPVRPAHACIRATFGACAIVVVGMESSAARLKRGCVRVGRTVVGAAAAAGSSAVTAATCIARGTVLKGLAKSGRVCARGACTVLSAAGKIARYVFIVVDPRVFIARYEFGSRLRFVRRGPLVRLSRWVARIVAGGFLGIGSNVRVAGGAAVRGSVKIRRLCTGGALLVLSFLPMNAVWTVKDIATLPPDNISNTGTVEIEQTMAASGIGSASTDATAADGSRLSCNKDEDHFNMTLCQSEDVALVGFSDTNSAGKEKKSSGSDQNLTSGPKDMLLKELDTAAHPCFDERSQTECLQGFSPSHSAVASLSFGLLEQDSNLDVAPKSQARSSLGNDPLLLTRVSYRQKAFVDVPKPSAQRSRRLVSGVTRAAGIVSTSGGSGKSGAAGAEGIGIRTVGVVRALRVKAAEEAAAMGCARPAKNRALRMALGSVLVAPATFRFGRYLNHNWTELRRVQVKAAAGLSTFFSEQLWEPCQAIVKQVLFRERQSFLVDQAALEDAETSLRNMLRDFVTNKQNRVPEEIREKVVSAMDMSVVSRKLEKETRGAIRGTVSGKIPQMLLIQGTYLKKELLQAMEGIDDLYQANQVTLRLISIVPAALVIVGTYKISTVLLQAAASRRLEPTTLVHRFMRALVRDMERLLTSSSGFASGGRVGDEGILDKEETGKLALYLHTLQTTLRKNSSRFDTRARRALEEDLSDMTRDSTTVLQQMEIIRRLQRSYPFLRPEGG